MTVRHFAYELPADILDRLSRLGHGGASPELSRKCAATLLRHSHAAVEEFLIAIRYDPGWLKDETDAPARYAHWVLLCLADGLRTIPSLGRNPPLHHLTLAAACPVLGWRQDEIHLLLRGQPLGQYLCELGLDYAYLAPLDDVAGCLNSRQRQTLTLKLQDSLDSLQRADEKVTMDRIEHALFPIFTDNDAIPVRDRVHAAIEAAMVMLSSPASPWHHLLSILD